MCAGTFHRGCSEGTDESLPFWYCAECSGDLDERDPAMSLVLMEFLAGDRDVTKLKERFSKDAVDYLSGVAEYYNLTVDNELYYEECRKSKLVVAPCDRMDILRKWHEELGHLGIGKFYEVIRDNFYW